MQNPPGDRINSDTTEKKIRARRRITQKGEKKLISGEHFPSCTPGVQDSRRPPKESLKIYQSSHRLTKTQ